jgi:general nucleoside transport system permease protein
MIRSRRVRGLAASLAAVALTGVIVAVGLKLGGYDPGAALRALISGAFGTPQRFFSFTLVRSTPLILTGLAVAIAFRTGVWNIGAEGQLYAGAVAAVWVGLNAGAWSPFLAVPLSLLAGATAGILWAAVPALMKLRLGVGEVITTILMNFVGIHMTSFMVRGPLQEARGVFPRTDQIAASARLPSILPGTTLHAGFAIAVLLAVATGVFLRYSAWGFRWRAVGAAPRAAHLSGGIHPGRTMFVAFLVSGLMAGLAGAVEVGGRSFQLFENFSPQWGYTAIAVALLARLDPVAVIVTGLFFGVLEAGSGAMQRDAAIPAVWVNAIQALLILAVLAVDRLLRDMAQRSSTPEGPDA